MHRAWDAEPANIAPIKQTAGEQEGAPPLRPEPREPLEPWLDLLDFRLPLFDELLELDLELLRPLPPFLSFFYAFCLLPAAACSCTGIARSRGRRLAFVEEVALVSTIANSCVEEFAFLRFALAFPSRARGSSWGRGSPTRSLGTAPWSLMLVSALISRATTVLHPIHAKSLRDLLGWGRRRSRDARLPRNAVAGSSEVFAA